MADGATGIEAFSDPGSPALNMQMAILIMNMQMAILIMGAGDDRSSTEYQILTVAENIPGRSHPGPKDPKLSPEMSVCCAPAYPRSR